MKIFYKNIKNERIKKCFTQVVKSYKALHNYEITLEQKRIKHSTMQAQPHISIKSLYRGVKRYKIKLGIFIRDTDERVSELPEDVLTGWFAHELGHIVDYLHYSNLGMLIYGVKYLVSQSFKRKVEHAADYIAIENGFHDEIIATKRYILDHDLIDPVYKRKLENYYLSVEQVEKFLINNVPIHPHVKL